MIYNQEIPWQPARNQSEARAARALRVGAQSRGGCYASKLAEWIGVPFPTAFHLADTLIDEEVLAKYS